MSLITLIQYMYCDNAILVCFRNLRNLLDLKLNGPEENLFQIGAERTCQIHVICWNLYVYSFGLILEKKNFFRTTHLLSKLHSSFKTVTDLQLWACSMQLVLSQKRCIVNFMYLCNIYSPMCNIICNSMTYYFVNFTFCTNEEDKAAQREY